MVAAVLGAQLAVSHALFGGIEAELLWLDAGLALLLVVAAFIHIASLTRQRRRLAVIDGVAETFASASSIEQTAEAGVAKLVAAGLADAALLAVMRSNANAGEGELMIPVARAGYPHGPTDDRPRSSSDVLPAAPTVSRERLVAEPWLAPLRERAGKRQWVARVPVARGEEALGLLLLASRRKGTLGDVALLETVGALFASALDHARLYEAAFERERELEEQDSRRREFLYAIAHELRTPLTSIQAFAELLSERRRSPEGDPPNLVDSLTRGVERLGSLVDDLLQLGRIEQGEVRVLPVHGFHGHLIGAVCPCRGGVHDRLSGGDEWSERAAGGARSLLVATQGRGGAEAAARRGARRALARARGDRSDAGAVA